jgi:ribosomal protein L40E
MRFEEAEQRLFANVWICHECKAKNRAGPGKKPDRCRKCGNKHLRLKKKKKKAVAK